MSRNSENKTRGAFTPFTFEGEKNKITDTQILAKNFYRSGIQYFAAATVLSAKIGINFEGETTPLIGPSVTNGAFACELFLKSLHCHYKKEVVRGHDLLELFNALPEKPENVRASIASYFANQTTYLASQERQAFSADDLVKKIKGISNAFIEARYVSERGFSTFNQSFIACFCEALYEECKKVQQTAY